MFSDDPLPDEVGLLDPMSVEWQYRIVGNQGWITMNQTDHKIYVVYENPPTSSTRVFDKALDFAVDFADGQSELQPICLKLAEGVSNTVHYDPNAATAPSEPIKALTDHTTASHPVNCMIHARAMEQLVESLTNKSADSLYLWGGQNNNASGFYKVGNKYHTLQITAQPEDVAGANPHFTYHSTTKVDGTYYDATYGTSGLPTILRLGAASNDNKGILLICGNVYVVFSLTGTLAQSQLQEGLSFEWEGSNLGANHPFHTPGHPDYICPHKPPPAQSRFLHP